MSYANDWSTERIRNLIEKLESEKNPVRETIDYFKNLLVEREEGSKMSEKQIIDRSSKGDQGVKKYLLSVEGDIASLRDSINKDFECNSEEELMMKLGENGYKITLINANAEQEFAYQRLEQIEYIIQQLLKSHNNKEIHLQEIRAEFIVADILIEGFYNRFYLDYNEKEYWRGRFNRLSKYTQ